MKTSTQIADMITTIKCTQGAREFIVGSEKIEDVAASWVECGFGADASEWWAAGCFDADRAEDLRDAGLTAAQVSADCPELEGYSWGYAHSNMNATTEDVVAACQE